ncbi:phage tail protein [Lysinibacillus capsici]|uniref:phage tail protein n=1 Tax=Lysinibacillus capsici TaxID=2115968 RepID=UPI003F21E1F1
MAQYGTIITNIGLAQIANAQITQTKVGLEYIALGDGNGAHYVPTQNQTKLVHEVWRGPIAELSIDPTNSNRIIIDAVIPVTAGGFTIREIGIFDDKNNLIAVGQYPEKYKPQLSEGVSEETLIHFVIETNNADVVKLTIDPTVIIASRNYVDGKVAQVQTALTEHSGQDVLSENGAHGIRYFNDKLETKNGTDWLEIEIGKANARGTQSLSPYHAIRRFPVFNGWANDTTAESLWLVMKDMTLSGQFIVRGTVGNGTSTANTGGFEYSLQVFRAAGATTQLSNVPEILYYSDYMNSRFNVHGQDTKVSTTQPVLPITKRQLNAPLYIEIEYISIHTDAFEALDSIEFELQAPQASPSTAPRQQSIFTHVGNSKANLATAITGKGVATSADATFATMVANIDAIPAKLTMTGTKLSPPNTYNFKFAKGTNTIYQPYISIEGIPFEPKIIRASSMTLTGNGEEYSSLYIGEDEGLGVNLSRHVSGFYGGATATGQSTYLMVASVTSLNGKWTVIMPVPIASRNYKYTIVG